MPDRTVPRRERDEQLAAVRRYRSAEVVKVLNNVGLLMATVGRGGSDGPAVGLVRSFYARATVDTGRGLCRDEF
jgi:hypothetical protein